MFYKQVFDVVKLIGRRNLSFIKFILSYYRGTATNETLMNFDGATF